jgi:hypothetical protein
LGGVPRNAQPMLAGLSQMRWMLGPLGAAGGEPQRVAAKKPMWRRALALAGY